MGVVCRLGISVFWVSHIDVPKNWENVCTIPGCSSWYLKLIVDRILVGVSCNGVALFS